MLTTSINEYFTMISERSTIMRRKRRRKASLNLLTVSGWFSQNKVVEIGISAVFLCEDDGKSVRKAVNICDLLAFAINKNKTFFFFRYVQTTTGLSLLDRNQVGTCFSCVACYSLQINFLFPHLLKRCLLLFFFLFYFFNLIK